MTLLLGSWLFQRLEGLTSTEMRFIEYVFARTRILGVMGVVATGRSRHSFDEFSAPVLMRVPNSHS